MISWRFGEYSDETVFNYMEILLEYCTKHAWLWCAWSSAEVTTFLIWRATVRDGWRGRLTVHQKPGGRPKHLYLPFNLCVSGWLMALKWQPRWHTHHTFIQRQLAMQIRRVSRGVVRQKKGGVIYMLKCSQLSTCRLFHHAEISKDRGTPAMEGWKAA